MNQKKQQDQINHSILENKSQAMSGRLGVIMSYDSYDNTATVQITKQQTDEMDQSINKVMCPRTLGVQTVAPQPGDLCWVAFKDDNITQALIINFYNHRYSQYDYPKQTKAHNALPSYLLGL